MYDIETRLWEEGFERIMGLDEVGRGCLAGPVVAAGVILPPQARIEEIDDSKKLSAQQRSRIAGAIKQQALYWTVQSCEPEEIDRRNIYWASIAAMEKCIGCKEAEAEYLLVDGKQYPNVMLPGSCLVKGDSRSVSIAAASVLAKVYRDELMHRLHENLPYFGWDTNVGYPTPKHYDGLRKYGITPYHRRSFQLKTDKEYQV